MRLFERKSWVFVLIGISLLLSLLACRIEAPSIVLDESPTPVPTKIVTQVITQIVIPTVAAPQNPPQTQATDAPVVAATPTWDPLSAPIYFPLKDCVASRLYIGDRAMVSLVGGANAIRTSTDLRTDTNIVGYAEPGEVVTILTGPECSDGFIIWFVETLDGLRGFTPEGDGNEYWLWPVGP
jgi:hypothetical protein